MRSILIICYFLEILWAISISDQVCSFLLYIYAGCVWQNISMVTRCFRDSFKGILIHLKQGYRVMPFDVMKLLIKDINKRLNLLYSDYIFAVSHTNLDALDVAVKVMVEAEALQIILSHQDPGYIFKTVPFILDFLDGVLTETSNTLESETQLFMNKLSRDELLKIMKVLGSYNTDAYTELFTCIRNELVNRKERSKNIITIIFALILVFAAVKPLLEHSYKKTYSVDVQSTENTRQDVGNGLGIPETGSDR